MAAGRARPPAIGAAHDGLTGPMQPEEVRRLATDGYVVVPFLDPAELRAARQVRDDLGPAPGDERSGFHSDAWSSDVGYKRRVAADLGRILGPAIRRTVPGHSVLGIAHLVKWPGADGGVEAHRDPTFVDERVHRSLTIWCPLDDLSDAMGTLRVVPGSHLTAEPVRCHDGADNLVPVATIEQVEIALDLRAGEAVVFDHALIHRSAANDTSAERTAIAVLLTPDGAEARYVLPTEDGVAVIAIDPDFFLDNRLSRLDIPMLLRRHRRIVDRPA
ncbi:MAG: phytanoyl-CoA dioxygenase family protein [Acidimicrobiales bacterium]